MNKVFIYEKGMSNILRLLIRLGLFFFDSYYFLLLILARIKRNKKVKETKKYDVVICAIFKNEALSLREWIEYHLLIGVDHFYLYNNFSDDNYYEVLKPYVEKSIVDLIDWPVNPPSQFSAYENFRDRFWGDCNWVAFLDLDEYICPLYDLDIKEWLRKYRNYHSIVVYWKVFGTAGRIEHDNEKLIVEQYCVCWDRYYDIGKVIFNTAFDLYRFVPSELHSFSAEVSFFGKKLSIPPVNEFKKFIKFKCNRIGFFNNMSDFTIQLNHYWSKSYNQFVFEKVKRGRAAAPAERIKELRSFNAFLWHENKNRSSDYSIWRFLIQLKIRLGMVDPIE